MGLRPTYGPRRGHPGRERSAPKFESRQDVRGVDKGVSMSLLQMLGIAWFGVTGILVLLLIYRSTLTIHEDDQLFLSEAESAMEEEQKELQRKMNRVQPMVRLFGAASALIATAIAVMYLWEPLRTFF
jgi:hypothetical protein